MNYKVYLENNKATRCELVKNIHDTADFSIIDNVKIINSLVVHASNEKDAVAVAERLAKKLANR